MAEMTKFESREAILSCSPAEYFNFITDLRNFGKFIPSDTIREWQAEEDACRFIIKSMGELSLRISSKIPYSSVDFSGIILVNTAFVLHSAISSEPDGKARVKLSIDIGLSPVLRIFASATIDSFLQSITDQMEKFKSWNR